MYHEARTTGTKLCKGPCGLEKHVLAFSADHSHSDGLTSICRDCEALHRKETPAYKKQLDKRIAEIAGRLRFVKGTE